MKNITKTLLVSLVLGFSILNPLFSQHNKSNSKRIISPDSLRDFDESAWRQSALINGGYIGDELNIALYYAKREHIINKYYPNTYDINNYKTLPSNVLNAPCVNEGFEAGNITGWTATSGTNTNSCAYPTATVPLGMGPTLTVLTTPLIDPVTGNLVPNSPLGGTMVAKLNNTSVGGKVIKLTQTFNVTPGNYLYDFAYYAVQNGPHTCCQQPGMKVRLRDCIGNLLACPDFSFNAPATNSATCPGTGPATWSQTAIGCPFQCVFVSLGWQKYSIDLTSYIGSCVTVEVMVMDCQPTGHYLYAYFDSNCNQMLLGVNGAPVSMPTQTLVVQAPCATTATLTAPGGLSPYTWDGPPLSGITSNTNQTISTAVPGNYTLQMNPFGICTPIFRIITLQFVPPLTVTATPSVICSAGSSTLTASGATTYTWSTGPTTPTTVVTPLGTTIYTVTAQTSTCITTGTIQVTVSFNPTITIAASAPTVCAGSPVTFTANGASTYTWNPGGLTGSVVVVTPTTSTTYTCTGSIASGCMGSATVFINVVATPTVTAFTSTSTICNGGSATLFAGGATTYTWNPGALSGAVVVVSPTVTTTYTVSGANGGACVGTSTVTLIVSTPTILISSSPPSICTGNSATLTASGAFTYTWNPGLLTGTSVTVTPPSTTIYTITGTNTLACVNAATFQLVVNITPTVTAVPTPTAICSGFSGTLTGSGATTYTWNPGGLTGTNVTVSPTITTIYTVTGSNGPCSNTNTVSLTVNSSPTITANASPTAICSGNTTTLTGTGAISYTWNPGALVGAVVTVTPGVTTTYTLTGINAFGCTSTRTVLVNVTITPTVTASSSPTAICLGSTAVLTGIGATTYTWNPGALTGSTISVSPASTTIYTVVGANGVCTDTKTVSLTVNPNPTITAISSPTAICAGASATLTGSGGTTYTWNPGAITGATITVTPASTTIYTVIGSNGTCSSTGTVLLTVNANPTVSAISSPTAICVAGSVTLTASGALSYTWNPGALAGTTVVVTPTINTTYTLTGVNAVGCTNSNTILVVVNTLPTVTASSSPTAICVGASATLSAVGATTYSWNPGALIGASVTVNPIVTTIYTVTGTSGACSSTATLTLIVNANPTVTASSSPTAICSGNSATLTGGGASTYTWNPGALTGATVTVSPIINTTYTLNGTNAAGCTSTQTVTLIVTTTPTVTAVSSPTAICSGASATLTSSGATTYTWNPGAITGGTITVTPTITTIYTVTGSNGSCTNTRTVSLTVNANPTVTASSSPTAICIGSSATLTGVGALTYTWNPGALVGTNVTVSPTITTIYTVTGSNGNCSNTNTVSLTVNALPTLTATSSPTAICSGASSTLTGSGASTYTWNPGALTGSTVTVTPVVTTIYTLTGTSVSGCVNTKTVSVNVTTTPTVIASSSPTNICSGSSATLTGSGATTYSWNPGALVGATVVVSPTITTTYTLIGANGVCTNSQTVSLIVTSSPTVIASASPTAICSGNSSTLSASGAISYTWNPGAIIGGTITVSPGVTTTYTVIGTNGLGCTNSQTLSLNVTATPTITASSSPTSICVGASATLTGLGAGSYTWNPGALTGTNVTVSPTVTTIYTVTGANGACLNTQTVSLTVNANPTVTASSSPTAICSGASATLTGSGATSYTWNPGALTGTNVTVSPTVTTIYTVTGNNGTCSNTNTISLTVNANPTVSAVSSPTSICVAGSVTLTASGALSYTWNPGATVSANVVVSPTVTTTYTVDGVNAAGCTNSFTLAVVVNTVPVVNAFSTSTAVCLGGSATLTAVGATTYTWNPGAIPGSTLAVTPLITTIYTVTGANGTCSGTATISLVVNPNPTVTAVLTPTSICSGNTATFTASGAITYTWNPGGLSGTTVTVSPGTTTTYSVRGTDASGCKNTYTFSLLVTPTPTLTAISSPTSICSGASATLTGSGATSYTWNPGALGGGTVVVTPTVNTTYTLTGDNGGCTSSQTLQVNVNTTPTVTAISSPTSICSGASSTLTGSGATTYTWNPGAISGATVVVTPTVTTTYTLTGDNGGCTSTQTVLLNVNPSPTLTANSSPTAICSGGTATLTGSGATSYTWNPGALSGALVTVSPASTTTYTLIGSSGGCTSTQTVLLVVNTTPTITANSTPTSLCLGSSATLTAAGATSYTWNPGALTGTSVVVSPTITTTYTITGVNGTCASSTQTLLLTVVGNPTVNAFAAPSPICSGASSTLSAFGAVTYTWNPGTITGNPITVTPTITTNYTVTGANASGCIGTRTLNVIVINSPTLNAISNPTSICSGATATLGAIGAVSYTWNPGALAGNTVVVSPTVTTNYTVTGANGFGCTSTKTVTLIVLSTPTIIATSSPTALCVGNSATLTGNGALTYTWNPGALTGSAVVVSPTVTTNYTITGANGACGSNTATLSLTVNSNPTVTAATSPTILCSGSSATLTGTGATTYTWNPGAITGATVVVTPTITTTYSLTGTNASGCTNTQTVSLSINPNPTLTVASTPTSICVSGNVTLTASGATSYTWNPGALTTGTIVVSPTVTTTYSITGANITGCSTTNTLAVVVNTVPIVTAVSSSTAICSGSSATLTGGGATTYTWNPGAIAGTTVVVTPTITTIYTVTGANGSCSNTQTVSLTVNPGPTVTASSSPTAMCAGSSATLTSSGALSYTWNPGAVTGSTVVVTPTVTTTYSVTGVDIIGCTNTATLLLNVNTPTIIAIGSPTAICMVGSSTLTASGAATYTWNPGALSGPTVVVTPPATTTYTVSGTNAFGCIGSSTLMIVINTMPTVTAVSSNTNICSGTSATLTGSGATTYTWNPGALTGSIVTVSPVINTTYTLTGANGACFNSTTLAIVVIPSPTGVTASNNGPLTCTFTSVNLFGATTSTNITYGWSGPAAFTSTVQNPTGISTGGTYTLTVTSVATGCSTSATTAVIANTVLPTPTITPTGSITCISFTVGLNTVVTPTLVTYNWNGPASFTSAVQNPTVNVAGNYTVVITDLNTGCVSTTTVAVVTNTNVPITATITPATCTGTVSNNNGTITLGNFTVIDKYDYVAGVTYTGAATYATATNIPISGIITNTLSNPLVNTPYTVRIFGGANGCFKDTTLILIPVDCSTANSLGIAKAVSTPTLNGNGSYDVIYKVVVRNTGALDLNNLLLTENLNATFPLPTTFSVTSLPVITTAAGTSLTLNGTFDGSSQTNITTALTSTLAAGRTDTIIFTVNIKPNGFFGTFNNRVIGVGTTTTLATLVDTSNVGINPDPDADGNPTNNNIPTPLNFTPDLFFGLTKEGSVSAKLPDNTFDITYTISVHNLGNDTLRNVVVKDKLFQTTIKLPATYTMKTAPLTTGNLVPNPLYEGNTVTDLLIPSTSKMAPGNVNTIVFTINVKPDTVHVIYNVATGTAVGTGAVAVTDTSNAGNNPDINNNGIWNEPSDNIPTVLVIPDTELFIPEAFTPNGDGKNDYFHIRGIAGIESILTVYNRWGNIVYKKDNYDNTWQGYPNAGGLTLGTDKLPPGTYYYILEFKHGEYKTTNGFVVLQY